MNRTSHRQSFKSPRALRWVDPALIRTPCALLLSSEVLLTIFKPTLIVSVTAFILVPGLCFLCSSKFLSAVSQLQKISVLLSAQEISWWLRHSSIPMLSPLHGIMMQKDPDPRLKVSQSKLHEQQNILR